MFWKKSYITSWDGTCLAVYDTLKGDTFAVLSNGLGGDIRAWVPLLEHFHGKLRFISWDYRGLYGSERGKCECYEIEHHAKDLEVLLEHFGVEKAVFFGWSMGVQVNFELYRRNPEKFMALVQINGVSGLPFEKAFYGKIPGFVWDVFFHFMKDGMRAFFPIARYLAKKSLLLKIAHQLGFFTLSEYKDIARELVLAWLSLDMNEYVKSFSALGRHDADNILPKISVPTLIIYGTRDFFTPGKFAVDMAKKIQGAEVIAIENGSHYTPLEFPDKVNSAVESFLRKHKLIK